MSIRVQNTPSLVNEDDEYEYWELHVEESENGFLTRSFLADKWRIVKSTGERLPFEEPSL